MPRRDYGTGAVFAPLFFTGGPALRARISGGEYQDVRARPVVGLSLARVPAIRPVKLHFRGRARAAPAADGDRSDDDIGVDHPIDVSTGHACDRP